MCQCSQKRFDSSSVRLTCSASTGWRSDHGVGERSHAYPVKTGDRDDSAVGDLGRGLLALVVLARTKVWAAGVKASALGARLGEQSGAAVDRSGRVAVLADCTLPGRPEVFVIGDLMSLNHLPGVAEVAMQSGRHAAHTIVRRLRGDDTTHEFRYRDLGTRATVSRFRAVAWFGPVRIAGPVAWLLWLVIHLAFLTGFKDRVATLASWTVAFLGRGRPERTITEQQVFARTRPLRRANHPNRVTTGHPGGCQAPAEPTRSRKAAT